MISGYRFTPRERIGAGNKTPVAGSFLAEGFLYALAVLGKQVCGTAF
jgi:hypothetical protein